jgi:hypothetical protein
LIIEKSHKTGPLYYTDFEILIVILPERVVINYTSLI